MGSKSSKSANGMKVSEAKTETGTVLVFLIPNDKDLSNFFELSFVHEPSGDIIFGFGARPREMPGLGAAHGGTVFLNSNASGAWGQEVHIPYAVIFGEPGQRLCPPGVAPLAIVADIAGITLYAGAGTGGRLIGPGGPLKHLHFFRYRRPQDAQLMFSGSVIMKCSKCSVRVPGPSDPVLQGWLPATRDPRLPNYLSPGAVMTVPLPLENETAALQWQVCGNAYIPSTAIPFGKDWSGEELFLARSAMPDGSILLGKAGRSSTFRGEAHFPYFGTEASCSPFEVLVTGGIAETVWTPLASGSPMPFEAVGCGRQANGQPLYPALVSHYLQGKMMTTVGYARTDATTGQVVATVAFCGDVVEFTSLSGRMSVLCLTRPVYFNDLPREGPPVQPSVWTQVIVGTPLPRFVGYSATQYGQYEAYRYEDAETVAIFS